MVRLYYTTDAFDPEGSPTPNVPLLLDEELRLIEPACLWFFNLSLVRGRTRSPNTWRSYAEALYDWFQTCSSNNWEWDNVTEYHIAAYRNKMLTGPSSYTGQPYSVRTVNGRLRRIMLFYKWCLRANMITELPFEYEELSFRGKVDHNLLAHLDPNPGVVKANVLTVRERARYPQAVRPDQLREIYKHLCKRDKLIVHWAVTTGGRRSDILGLTHHTIPETKQITDTRKIIPVTIKSKGGVTRELYPSIRLLDRTNDYIYEERASVIKKNRKRAGYSLPSALWLTKQGTPLSKEALHKNYSAACKKAGVKATFHDLRHTFAIYVLAELQRQAARNPDIDLNPLKAVQKLLGHAHLSTTDIYLQALQLGMESIEDIVQAMYEDLI